MQMEFGAILAGKARRPGKEDCQATVDDLAFAACAVSPAQLCARQAPCRQPPRTTARDRGPEIRMTATPDGGLPLDSAKIVSGNCICAGLPIALTSCPTTGRDGRVPLPQANLLSEETSPYLRQHKDNPVHWRPWSEATLAEARELDRPILLSVGYAACHWCHVMAHECFEDAEVAGLMNRLYVNIKVDREERPDIDQIFMAALSATGEQGGWPLTMFLTPDAKPFWGGTYFPKKSRYGRPGFMQVLESIDRAWRDRRGELADSAQTLKNHVESTLSARASVTEQTARANLPALASGIHSMIDQQRGGLRGAPKFPNAPFMQTLWLSWLETGDTAHRDAVLLSLRHMLNGGIYDHIGGGLCRYSTDAEWLVPHFEKMLYDNAMLIRLANWAFARNRRATVSRPNRNHDRLAAARDARRRRRLRREPRRRQRRRGGLLLHVGPCRHRSRPGQRCACLLRRLRAGSAAWLGRQADRPRNADAARSNPPRSDPCSPSSLPRVKNACVPAATTRCWPTGTAWRLPRSPKPRVTLTAPTGWRPHKPPTVSLPNQRMPTGGCRTRSSATANSSRRCRPTMPRWPMPRSPSTRRRPTPAYLADAVSYLQALDRWYIDEDNAGHYLTASDSRDVPLRIRGDVDEAIPSATSQIIEAFARTATATGRLDLLDRAWTIARAATGRIRNQAYGQAGIVNACTILEGSRKLVVVDDQNKPVLSAVATRRPDPRRVDIALPLGAQPVELPGSVHVDTEQTGGLALPRPIMPAADRRSERTGKRASIVEAPGTRLRYSSNRRNRRWSWSASACR